MFATDGSLSLRLTYEMHVKKNREDKYSRDDEEFCECSNDPFPSRRVTINTSNFHVGAQESKRIPVGGKSQKHRRQP